MNEAYKRVLTSNVRYRFVIIAKTPSGRRPTPIPGSTSGVPREDDTVRQRVHRRRFYAPVIGEPMTYGHLGRSGLQVSRLGLGTMNFGYLADEPSSFAVMDAAFDAGIILFDTADVYGGPQSPGHGQDLRHLGTNRWAVAGAQWAPGRHRLATKVYQSMGPGPNERRLSAYHIRRACEASLRRLQTDHIDLYQMHHVDRATPWEEVVPALRHLGIGLIPYSPLHAGLLTGALEAEAQGQLSPGQLPRVDAHRDQLRAYEDLCREVGAKPAHVALAWLLHNPVVSSTIVGAMTIEKLHADLGALSVRLDADTLQRLDRIWPGPGEAPQAYSW